jgi:hypothetical protein
MLRRRGLLHDDGSPLLAPLLPLDAETRSGTSLRVHYMLFPQMSRIGQTPRTARCINWILAENSRETRSFNNSL